MASPDVYSYLLELYTKKPHLIESKYAIDWANIPYYYDAAMLELITECRCLNVEVAQLKEPKPEKKKTIWVWEHANGKYASSIFNTEQEAFAAWGHFSRDGRAVQLGPVP